MVAGYERFELRRTMNPTSARPASIMAHCEGSGTGVTRVVPVEVRGAVRVVVASGLVIAGRGWALVMVDGAVRVVGAVDVWAAAKAAKPRETATARVR
jgi:hypothetical protein